MPPKSALSKSATSKKASQVSSAKASTVNVIAPPAVLEDGRELWIATEALQKAKAMRNYFQIERDRLCTFWDIAKKQLEEITEKCRQKEQEEMEADDRHSVETNVFKQKIRNLLYENQLQLSSMKEEAERAFTIKQEEYRQIENKARGDARDAAFLSRETDGQNRDMKSALLLEHDKAIAEQQAAFELQIRELHASYEHRIREMRDDMDLKRREEISAIEKRKEDHVAELKEVHERTFKEIKDYYSEITSNNLETIRTLKDEVYARKRTESHNEKAMYDVAQRNKKLTEPLAKLLRQKKELEEELANYAEDKEKLRQLKETAHNADQEYQKLSWEHEVLSQRFARLVEDRDIILNKYNAMLQDIQRKSAFKRVLIHKKLELVQNQLEGRDAELTELLKQANINAEDIKGADQKIHDLLSEKDKTIEDLQQCLLAESKRNERIISTYENYLKTNGFSGLLGSTKGK